MNAVIVIIFGITTRLRLDGELLDVVEARDRGLRLRRSKPKNAWC